MKPSQQALAAIGLIALLLLILPFWGLLKSTEWIHFNLVNGDFQAIQTSLVYTVTALVIIIILGTPLAYWLARFHFRGKWLAELLILIPLLTPPLAMGILLSTVYGPYSWTGEVLSRLGITTTNSTFGFLLAQVYSAAPYYIVTARSAFEGVPKELEQVALTLGKTRWQCFFHVTLPLAKLGLAAATGLAWVRALGEFGVVLIIAYFPQGIPVKLWVNLQDYGIHAVYPLLWLFFLIAMPIPLFLGLLSRRHNMANA